MKKLFTFIMAAFICSSTIFANMPVAETQFYIRLNDNWSQGGNIVLRSYNDERLTMTAVPNETGLYETTITSSFINGSGFELLRVDPGSYSTWDKIYGLNELEWGVNNCFVINEGVWGSDGVSALNSGTATVYPPTTAPSVSLEIPSKVFVDEEIRFSATSQNVTNPIFTFKVKVPGSADFVVVTSPYQPPSDIGTYEFCVEVAESASAETILASDTRDVKVKAVPDPITIGVQKPSDWDNIAFWNWNDDTAGKFVTPDIDGDWYTYTFERMDGLNIIFNDGTEWSSLPDDAARLAKQTVDIKDITKSTYYEIKDAIQDDEDPDWGKRAVNVSVYTSVENPIETGIISVKDNIIRASFEGQAQINLYNINGQLMHSVTAENEYTRQVPNGVYLLRVNNATYKLIVY